jgi:branched-subunit amino acid ABC-type transport system permease component
VGEFFGYVLASIPYGCAFSLVAVGLVLTYRATGVFNFAFAAEAYAATVIYSELITHGVQRGWAAVIVVCLIAPVFGAFLDFGLFSRVPPTNRTAKTIMALGLMVVLPQIVQTAVPSTPLEPPVPFFSPSFRAVWRFGPDLVTGSQICEVAGTVLVLIGLMVLLRNRRFGLPIRAAVESPKLLELSGVDARWVLRFAWMISTALAALAGVLYQPGGATVDPHNYDLLLVASIAAAALAGLRNLPMAVLGGVLLGLAETLVQGYVPSSSIAYTALVPSLPFFFLLVLLIFHPTLRHLEDTTDPMAAVEPPPPTPAIASRPPVVDRTIRRLRWPFLAVMVLAVIVLVPSDWTSALTQGAALSIVFLSITLLTGLAGQLSLAQWMFAGIGASTTAQLAENKHWPILLAALAGALVAGLAGWIAALPALRLRGLPVALLTLCLALLGDNLLFPTSWVANGSTGVPVPRPSSIFGIDFSSVDSEGFFVLTVVVMLAVAGIVHLLLRGTTGRALTAVHASPVGAAASGVPIRRMTVLVFIISASIAGLGGSFWAMNQQFVSSDSFLYYFGPIYLVVVVAIGATTVEGAITAGMAWALINTAFNNLPNAVGGTQLGSKAFTVILLSVGAFTYARHPEGIVEFVKRRLVTTIFRGVEHHERALVATAEDTR